MRVADYISKFLSQHNVKHIFMLPCGAAMHLNDAFGKNPDLEVICNLHEQACAISAEACSRVTGQLSVVNITAGPGSTNTITGLAGAWLDSTPVMFISGQVKTSDLRTNMDLRQYGVQEIDTVGIVEKLTKYSITVTVASEIRYCLQKAMYIATTGRKGPVWLDIPLDIQGAEIEPDTLTEFIPPTADKSKSLSLKEITSRVVDAYKKSKRPVLLVGNGVRAAEGLDQLHKLINNLHIPTLTSWLGMDLIDNNHTHFYGRPGGMAPRGSNYIIQNCDFLLTIGTRIDLGMAGYDYKNFARAAKKLIVDIDLNEINKFSFEIEEKINFDAKDFLIEMNNQCSNSEMSEKPNVEWQKYCSRLAKQYPIYTNKGYTKGEPISMYDFSEKLSKLMEAKDVIASCSSGFASEIFYLMYKHKDGQRIFHNRGTGSMGFGLPAAIGACIGSDLRRTICVEGDGGFQMNIQELETLSRLDLPVKVFVINNGGYASIRAAQNNYFGRKVGADKSSGISFPKTSNIAKAYGIRTKIISDPTSLENEITEVLNSPGPVVCEVIVRSDEPREPRLASFQKPDGSMESRPLEDLYPFLEREEFKNNMIIPILGVK